MMRFLLMISLSLFTWPSMAQFGLRIHHEINQESGWQEILDGVPSTNADIFSQSQSISIDYWLRLKNVRIELLPDITYSRFRHNSVFQGGPSLYQMDVFGIGMNGHIYPFDFFGDCDCPTFSKQGKFFQKGFFLLMRAGIQQYAQEMTLNANALSNTEWGATISGGMGLDIGINNLITLSPIFILKLNPAIDWNEFSSAHGFTDTSLRDESTFLRQWQFGLRIGFRPDYRQ